MGCKSTYLTPAVHDTSSVNRHVFKVNTLNFRVALPIDLKDSKQYEVGGTKAGTKLQIRRRHVANVIQASRKATRARVNSFKSNETLWPTYTGRGIQEKERNLKEAQALVQARGEQQLAILVKMHGVHNRLQTRPEMQTSTKNKEKYQHPNTCLRTRKAS